MRYDRDKTDAIFVGRCHHSKRSWKIIFLALIVIIAISGFFHVHHAHVQEAANQAAEARVVRGYKPSDVQKNLDLAVHQYKTGKMATANLKKAHYKAVRISDPNTRGKMVYKTNQLIRYMHSNHY